mgnify:CR=1 FL=1
MYEKEIIQLLEKLDDNERKEILDFAEFINSRHIINENENNTNSLQNLDGIFNKYAKRELIDREKDLAWTKYVKEKYLDTK